VRRRIRAPGYDPRADLVPVATTVGDSLFLGRHDIADRLARLLDSGQAGQPYLFVGPDGSGKDATALEIARRINCIAPDSCAESSRCESCQKALTFQHPDIRWIGPAAASVDEKGARALFEEKIGNPFFRPGYAASSQVLIGHPEHPGPLTIRSLIQFLRLQSFQGRWKVAIVADAHRMNASAANAFLKTLEEPPPGSLIMMLTSSTAGLLPTILSRCQKVVFEPYPEAEMARILAELAPDLESETCRETARLAGGDARKALALLEPETLALRNWAEEVYVATLSGRLAPGQLAAENLNAGNLPGGASTPDTAIRRQRALTFCETLQFFLAETVACRAHGDAWQPRLKSAAPRIREVAVGCPTEVLLQHVARIEQTKHEIDGNLNVGLVMAVMLQDLGDRDTGGAHHGLA